MANELPPNQQQQQANHSLAYVIDSFQEQLREVLHRLYLKQITNQATN